MDNLFRNNVLRSHWTLGSLAQVNVEKECLHQGRTEACCRTTPWGRISATSAHASLDFPARAQSEPQQNWKVETGRWPIPSFPRIS